MKEFTKEELLLIEECGACQLVPADMAIVLEINADLLSRELGNPESALYKRFNKGRLVAEMQVRKSIFSMASQGATQAQSLYIQLMEELKIAQA